MAVTINLDLNAKGIVQEVAKIEAALKALDERGGDIDLGDSLDASGITGEIGKVIDELNSLETDVDRLSNKLNGLNDVNLDSSHEVVRTIKDETGSTNGGGSSGNDPPGSPGQAALSGGGSGDDDSAASPSNSMKRTKQLLNREYGANIQMPRYTTDAESKPNPFTTAGLRKMSSDRRLANLGHRDPTLESTIGMRTGTRSGFGLDSINMDLRRLGSELDLEEIAGSTGFSDSDFLGAGSGLSPFHQNIAETMAQAKYDAWGGKSGDLPGLFNGIDPEELTLSEMQGVMSGKANSASDPGERDTRYEFGPDSDRLRGMKDAARKYTPSDFDTPDRDMRDVYDRDKGFFGVENRKQATEKFRKNQKKLGQTVRRLIPSMSKYMQVLAAIIPIAIGLGVQLLGVASALGAVGVAGAAMMGLGLIGHGDSMADSFAQAKMQMRELKREMFSEVQPLAQQFAPIQDRMFDAIPQGMDRIFEEMEGLRQFEGTLFALGGGLADGVEEFFAIINANGGAIDQLSRRFASIAGSGILNFFEWLIQTAYENQQLLVSVGADMMKLAVVVYNVSMAVVRLVSALTPLINFLTWLSGLLNGGVILGLAAMVAYLYVMGSLISFVIGLGSAFAGLYTWISASNFSMLGFASSTWAAVAAATALVATLSVLTLGGLAVGAAVTGAVESQAGVGGGGAPSGDHNAGNMGSTTYNDNRQYTFNTGSDDYADQKDLESTVEKHNETQNATEVPTTNFGGD